MKALRLLIVVIALTTLPPSALGGDDGLPALIQTLQNAQPGEQSETLESLEGLGLDGISAMLHVVPLLESRDRRVQARAARVLGGMRKDAAPAIPKLIALLGADKSPWIMTDVGGIPCPGDEAALALAAIGADAVTPLTECLDDRDRVVRFQAAYALGKIGPAADEAAPALLKLLDDPESVVRLAATWSLVHVAPNDEKAIHAVIARMKDKHKDVRATAADVLKDIRPVPGAVIDALVEGLEDQNELVQAHAARTLGQSGSDAIPAVGALTKMLKSRKGYPYPDGHPYSDRPMAQMAARALGQIGPPAKAALPALLDTIRDTRGTFEDIGIPKSNEVARAEAAEAAARIDPQSDELVGVLKESLTGDPRIREGVAWALARMGTKAAPARARLVELLREEDSCKLPLACAVLSIDPKDAEAFDTLLKELRAGEPIVGEEHWPVLAAILERSDPQGRRTIRALVKYLGGDNLVEDTVCALRTLAHYGPKASVGLDAIMKLLDDAFDEIRSEAVTTMWRIAPAPREFFGRALKEADPPTRRHILEALKSVPESAPVLIDALDNPSASVRFAALSALDPSRVDDRARRFIDKLRQDESRSIREASESLLKRAKSDGPPR